MDSLSFLSLLSFVNNVKTPDGGSHEVGFKTGITKAFNDLRFKNLIIRQFDVWTI